MTTLITAQDIQSALEARELPYDVAPIARNLLRLIDGNIHDADAFEETIAELLTLTAKFQQYQMKHARHVRELEDELTEIDNDRNQATSALERKEHQCADWQVAAESARSEGRREGAGQAICKLAVGLAGYAGEPDRIAEILRALHDEEMSDIDAIDYLLDELVPLAYYPGDDSEVA